MCLFAICVPTSVKYRFMSFTHFLIGLFVFLMLTFEGSLYVLCVVFWSEVRLAIVLFICFSSTSLGHPMKQWFLTGEAQFIRFSFMDHAWVLSPRTLCLAPRHMIFLLCVFLNVLWFTFYVQICAAP